MREPSLFPLLVRLGGLLAASGVVIAGLATAERPDGRLIVPVEGVARTELRDSFAAPRAGNRRHGAIDIMAARGTAVLATDDGIVVRLDESPRGGIAVYQRDALGLRCFYYGHLERHRPDLEVGTSVRRGETLGFVGSTGNAPDDTPHLHFEIHESDRTGRCRSGATLNPFVLLGE